MKNIIFSLFVFGLFLTGCKTQQTATNSGYDDVYYRKSKDVASAQKETVTSPDLSSPKNLTAKDTALSKTPASVTTEPDNTDYSARFKRSHELTGNRGYSDNSYTNPGNNDSTQGNTNVNVYVGSGYDPYGWGSGLSFGLGYGCGYGGFYGGWGWDYPYYWYSPYYYYGWPGSYYYGYWDGYWNGYYWGNSEWYHPWWDNGNHYYGHRRSLFSHDGTRGLRSGNVNPSNGNPQTRTVNPNDPGVNKRSEANAQSSPSSVSTRSTTGNNPATGKSNTYNRRGTNPNPVIKRTPADQKRYQYTRSANPKPTPYQRNTVKNTRVVNSVPRYVRPENNIVTRQGQTQNYSSPAYRQPKSSQEYLSPRSQAVQNNGERGNTNSTRTYSAPSGNERRISPAQNTRTYSTPSNINRSNYNAPSRSYTPGNSGSTHYSAPSPSNNSYSSPSRSGGNSSGGSNSGSSGGGRRK